MRSTSTRRFCRCAKPCVSAPALPHRPTHHASPYSHARQQEHLCVIRGHACNRCRPPLFAFARLVVAAVRRVIGKARVCHCRQQCMLCVQPHTHTVSNTHPHTHTNTAGARTEKVRCSKDAQVHAVGFCCNGSQRAHDPCGANGGQEEAVPHQRRPRSREQPLQARLGNHALERKGSKRNPTKTRSE